jgi:hypothetical protein
MPKPKNEGNKKHGDALENLIERTETGKRDENAEDPADRQDGEDAERSNP